MKIPVTIEGKKYKLSYFEWLAYISQKKIDRIEKKLSKAKIELSSTLKGIAITAAIESGLLPKVDGGWDDSNFKVFWDKFEKALKEQGYLISDVSKDGDN